MTDKTDPRLDALWPFVHDRGFSAGAILRNLDAAARDAGYVPMLDTRDEALVERIAKAIHSAFTNDPDCDSWDYVPEWHRENRRQAARAVIAELLREES